MTTPAAIPLQFELPHVLMLVWLLAGALALWIAKRLHLPRQKSVNILLPMALGLMVFALYLGTRFNYDFLIDDIDIVQTNPDVVEADGWRTLWTHDYWSDRSTDDNLYRPVTILSYWVNARLPLCGRIVDGRAEEIYPRYFRGVNIVLLTGLAWLLALWLSHYVQQAAAWTVAFLFAGHAAHAEMVNYIVCRADLLAMLGVVGFLYMQRLAIERQRWRWWSAALAALSALVAFGSKESGLILLPAALVQAWTGPRNASTDITDDIAPTPRGVTLGWVALIALPLMLYAVGRINVVGYGADYTGQFMDDLRDNPLREVSLAERIPAALAIAWFYFKQLVSPNTSYYHIPAQLPHWGSAATILGFTLLIASVGLLWFYLARRRWQVMAIVLALGQYLLIGNLLMPVGVYAANRLILPFSIAAAVLLAGLLHYFVGLSPRRRAVVILPSTLFLIVAAYEIQDVNHVWRTEMRLMGRDHQLAPEHPVAMYNFGTVKAREAVFVDRYVRALTLGLYVSSKAETQAHQLSDSLAETIEPTLNQIRDQLAELDETQHHLDQTQPLRDVITLFDRTLIKRVAVLTPDDITGSAEKLRNDIEHHAALSKQYWAEALVMLQQVVAMRPGTLSGRLELARTLELRGLKEEARDQYRQLVNLGANDMDVRVIEARIRYSKLCIDLSRDKDGAEKSLAIAEAILASLLEGKTPMAPGQVKDLHALNRNAKRYLGVLAWKDNRLQTAIRRHAQLLRQYPDFQEAIEDHRQWIDQLAPPDVTPRFELPPQTAPEPAEPRDSSARRARERKP